MFSLKPLADKNKEGNPLISPKEVLISSFDVTAIWVSHLSLFNQAILYCMLLAVVRKCWILNIIYMFNLELAACGGNGGRCLDVVSGVGGACGSGNTTKVVHLRQSSADSGIWGLSRGSFDNSSSCNPSPDPNTGGHSLNQSLGTLSPPENHHQHQQHSIKMYDQYATSAHAVNVNNGSLHQTKTNNYSSNFTFLWWLWWLLNTS